MFVYVCVCTCAHRYMHTCKQCVWLGVLCGVCLCTHCVNIVCIIFDCVCLFVSMGAYECGHKGIRWFKGKSPKSEISQIHGFWAILWVLQWHGRSKQPITYLKIPHGGEVLDFGWKFTNYIHFCSRFNHGEIP